MGSSASRDTAAPEEQDRVLRLKLAVISNGWDTSIFLVEHYINPGHWNKKYYGDSIDFARKNMDVDGQEVQVGIWSLS